MDGRQRKDIKLDPLEGSASSIHFQLEFTGISIKNSYDVMPYLSGENYFSQSGTSKGNNTYEFILPQPGSYSLSIHSKYFSFDAGGAIIIRKNKTLKVQGTKKDTWLIVKVKDSKGNLYGYPPEKRARMHEPQINCVILDKEKSKKGDSQQRSHRYLDHGPIDVGGALRPNPDGQVKFLLTKGGQYFLRTNFEGFKKSVKPVRIKTHKTRIVELKLEKAR